GVLEGLEEPDEDPREDDPPAPLTFVLVGVNRLPQRAGAHRDRVDEVPAALLERPGAERVLAFSVIPQLPVAELALVGRELLQGLAGALVTDVDGPAAAVRADCAVAE